MITVMKDNLCYKDVQVASIGMIQLNTQKWVDNERNS